MKIATAAEMAEVDRFAAERCGVPVAALMEEAGRRVAEAAGILLGDAGGHGVLLVCGRGNNGGDGFVAARLLRAAGARPIVLLAGEPAELRAEAGRAFAAAERAGVEWLACPDAATLAAAADRARDADLVVDALLGTGFVPPARGVAAEAIRLVNALGRPVLAVDLPSGLRADGAEVEGEAVVAAATVTFGYPKPCLALHPAAALAGRVWCADIGFPAAADGLVAGSLNLATPADLAAALAPRRPDSHKGTYGHVLLVAGSRGLAGAAALAARGALRGGAGLVTVAMPASVTPAFLPGLPEAMTLPLPDDGRGFPGADAAEVVAERLSGARALAVGPGLSTSPGSATLVCRLAAGIDLPLVLDADALNALAAQRPAAPPWRGGSVVLTPHPGELARLLGLGLEAVRARRVEAAREAARAYRAVVVLKGARTVVATPGGEVWVNPTGNPGMAAGGMGDVLTGVIAAQLARGLAPLEAALCGVYLHGLAGDLARSGVGPWGLLASEVADLIPAAARCAGERRDDRAHPKLSLVVA